MHSSVRHNAHSERSRRRQRRSSSWSGWASHRPSDSFFSSTNSREELVIKRAIEHDKRSVTFDDCLSNEEVREGLSLPRDTTQGDSLGACAEIAEGKFEGYMQRGRLVSCWATGVYDAGLTGHGVVESSGYNGNIPLDSASRAQTTFWIAKPQIRREIASPTIHSSGSSLQHTQLKVDTSSLSRGWNISTKGAPGRREMRTVSQDDYLLARGANPRTGVVTPSCSSNSPADDRMRATELDSSSKWRLKGDQWISLAVGQPTPLPSPPALRGVSGPAKPLRTPPKLAVEKFIKTAVPIRDRHDNFVASVPSADAPSPPTLSTRQIADFQRRLGHSRRDGKVVLDIHPLKEEKPMVDEQNSSVLNKSELRTRPLIQRKPIGTPPGKNEREGEPPNPSTETVVKRSTGDERLRSSSAPTPVKHPPFAPDDIGKALPALPVEAYSARKAGETRRDQLHDQSFLGPRDGSWTEYLPSPDPFKGLKVEKGLPCLPTSNIRSHLPASDMMEMRSMLSVSMPMQTNRFENQIRQPSGPRIVDKRKPPSPLHRPQIPSRHYHLVQDLHAGKKATSSILPLPYPDARHHQPFQPRAHTGIIGPRMMIETNAINEKGQPLTNTFTTPPPITSTHIPIHTTTNQKGQFQEIQHTLKNEKKSAVITTRPNMTARADGIHSVPGVSLQETLPQRHQGSTTGTSLGDVSATSGNINPNLIPSPLKPSCPTVNMNMATNLNVAASQHMAQARQQQQQQAAGQLAMDCHHCQGSSAKDVLLSMPGSTPMLGSRAGAGAEADNADRTGLNEPADMPGTVEFSGWQNGDHSGCCTECCALGCHEGCLGHPQTPAAGVSVVQVDYNGELNLQRKALRDSLRFRRVRKNLDGSIDTEALEVTELETPTEAKVREKGLTFSVKEALWDSGVSSSAIAAAQNAMGSLNLTLNNKSRVLAAAEKAPSAHQESRTLGRHTSSAPLPGPSASHRPEAEDMSNTQRIAKENRERAGLSESGKQRAASNASIMSIRSIELPGFGTAGAVLEHFMIPVDAIRMWIRNHPQAISTGKEILGNAAEMGWCVLITGRKMYKLCYLYSKTGRLKPGKGQSLALLIRDCIRSVVYLLLFATAAVFVGRVLGGLLRIGYWLVWGLRGVLWLLRQFGFGLLW